MTKNVCPQVSSRVSNKLYFCKFRASRTASIAIENSGKTMGKEYKLYNVEPRARFKRSVLTLKDKAQIPKMITETRVRCFSAIV